MDDLTAHTITVYTDNLEPCQQQLHYLPIVCGDRAEYRILEQPTQYREMKRNLTKRASVFCKQRNSITRSFLRHPDIVYIGSFRVGNQVDV